MVNRRRFRTIGFCHSPEEIVVVTQFRTEDMETLGGRTRVIWARSKEQRAAIRGRYAHSGGATVRQWT